MHQTLTTLPKESQSLSGGHVAANAPHSISELRATFAPYQWAAFLFENESDWAAYALTRARDTLTHNRGV